MKRTFANGDDAYITRKKNAYRFPKDKEAIIPQAEEPVYIDKRTSKANINFLVREKGTKDKNLKKQAHLEAISKAFKGNDRETEIIDLNSLVQLDEYGNIDMDKEANDLEEKFNINEDKKSYKFKNNKQGMDIDDVFDKNRKSVNSSRRRTQKGRKSKSYKIINF